MEDNPVNTIPLLLDLEIEIKNLGRRNQLLRVAQAGEADTVEELLVSGLPVDGEESENVSAQARNDKSSEEDEDSDYAVNGVLGVKGITPLMVAAREGHSEVCKILLQYKADPGAQDSLGNTALLYAASMGQNKAVEVLVEHEKVLKEAETCNNQGFTPLLAAAQKGHTGTCRLLLSLGISREQVLKGTNYSAVMLAAATGNHDTMKAILSYGSNEGHRDHLARDSESLAKQEGHLTCVEICSQSRPWDQKKIHELGLMTDENKVARIHLPAAKNRAGVIRSLLVGYDKDDREELQRYLEGHGRTPLMEAAKNGALETVAELLRWDADPNFKLKPQEENQVLE